MSGKERLRREKVRILLRTRNDAYPTLRARGTPSTPAGAGRAQDVKKIKCPSCQGVGKTRLHQKCDSCDGKGKIPHDGYVGRVSTDTQTIFRPMTPEATEAEIQRLGSSLKLSAGEIDPHEKYGWERARERQNASGSYRELERALEWLREHHAIAWDFLMWAYGPLEPALSRRDREIEDYLVAAVAERMPSLIKVPGHEWEALKEKRRQKIRELSSEATPEEIADLVGLSLRTVQQILAESLSS